MNQNTLKPTLIEQNTLHEVLLDDIHQIISDAVSESEKMSKEKYQVKLKLIESASDMSTQEKLDAIDKNYDCWNQEHWQNILTLTVASVVLIGLVAGSSVAIKATRKLIVKI